MLLKGCHMFVHGIEKKDGEYVIELDGTHSGNVLVCGPYLSKFIMNGHFIGVFEL